MGWFEVVFIFIVSWWMILFMVLPFRSHVPESPDEHHYHGAPQKAQIKPKLLVTTILAIVATFVLSYLLSEGILTLWLPYRF